ncbi:hypothetical protein LZS92_07660 [Vibrio campbellii]|nr:hypothetical protein [Vibrio campbellii]
MQGGSEFGPRSLGYRSILSPADKLGYKQRLNTHVKQRESFRPFSTMILDSNVNKITADSLANPFMLSAAQILESQHPQYPALIHVDGTIRIQVVEEDGGLIHQILTEYERLTGQIAIINTSFNGCNEPIVETIEQAKASAA